VIADICDVANPHVFLSAGTNWSTHFSMK
jgi:hypothetical protein